MHTALAGRGSGTGAQVAEFVGRSGGSLAARLVRVVRARVGVFAEEVLASALLEPVGELGQLLSQTADGLRVHVGLGYELGEGH